MTALYCGFCGKALTQPHLVCSKALQLEPPRYCVHCGRRMKVQVLPTGWHGVCVAHGAVSHA